MWLKLAFKQSEFALNCDILNQMLLYLETVSILFYFLGHPNTGQHHLLAKK